MTQDHPGGLPEDPAARLSGLGGVAGKGNDVSDKLAGIVGALASANQHPHCLSRAKNSCSVEAAAGTN